jgi:hypothetical protein
MPSLNPTLCEAIATYDRTVKYEPYEVWPNWIKDTFFSINAGVSEGLEIHGEHATAVYNYKRAAQC